MLGWACERAGIGFEIFDPGDANAASRVGAGLVSPLTGQRLVPTWKFAEWREPVLQIYRELEQELGLALVREFRIRRLFRDDRQRELFLSRVDRPEVAPWIESIEDDALILHGALQIDTAGLVAALRDRWIERGVLTETKLPTVTDNDQTSVIWCTGATAPPSIHLPWEPSRGEVLRGRIPGFSEEDVLNNGHWMFGTGKPEQVLVGAIFDRDFLDAGVTAQGQHELATAAQAMIGALPVEAMGQSGVRVNLRDRRPVVGWCDESHRVGVFSGLAAKGALWAPMLAGQWAADRLTGEQLEPEARVARFL